MAHLKDIVRFLDSCLELDKFPGDSSNNGLQVEGRHEVVKAVFGVDACLELFRKAVEMNADFIFVHHGLSWKDSLKRLTGINTIRLSPLFNYGISLYAAHLPLDAHAKKGHNSLLADMAGLKNRKMFFEYAGNDIGIYGELDTPLKVSDIAAKYESNLNAEAVIYGDESLDATKIAVISGGGGHEAVESAAEAGAEIFITGEITHEAYHVIKDLGITVISLGHYASEKPGVIAVMDLLKAEFDIDTQFIEIPTGL